MSATSRIGVFIGYDEEKVGYYKVWETEEQKLYRTRDVHFDEHNFSQSKSRKHTKWFTRTVSEEPHPELYPSLNHSTTIYDLCYTKGESESEQCQPVAVEDDDNDDLENKHHSEPRKMKYPTIYIIHLLTTTIAKNRHKLKLDPCFQHSQTYLCLTFHSIQSQIWDCSLIALHLL